MVQYVKPTLAEVGLLRKPGQDEVMMTDRSCIANVQEYMMTGTVGRAELALTSKTDDNRRGCDDERISRLLMMTNRTKVVHDDKSIITSRAKDSTRS